MKELGFEILDISLGESEIKWMHGIHFHRNTEDELWEYVASLHGKKVAIPYGINKIIGCNFDSVSGDVTGEMASLILDNIDIAALYIPNTVDRIYKKAIQSSTVEEVYLPDSITIFGDDTTNSIFMQCKNLTTIHYSGTLTEGAPWGATNATLVK